jgi:hypothetical protein
LPRSRCGFVPAHEGFEIRIVDINPPPNALHSQCGKFVYQLYALLSLIPRMRATSATERRLDAGSAFDFSIISSIASCSPAH